MLLKNIMSDYLVENNSIKFEIENNFKPIKSKSSEWVVEDKRMTKSFDFDDKRFLEQFIVEILKYNREADAEVEVRFKKNKVGIIVYATAPQLTEIEFECSKDIDKIKKDIMYYYAR